MENFFDFDPMAWAGQSEQPNNIKEVKASSVEPSLQKVSAEISAVTPSDEREKIMAVGQELLKMGANIADSYSDWLRLGFALADGLGSEGRDLFHKLSAASAKYREVDCEKKWQQCLAKGNGRTTVKTFYFMAKQAGVDLSEIGRRFPSNPLFPQPEGKELEYIGMVLSEDSLSLPQGEGSEESEGVEVFTDEKANEDNGGFSETFSDKINPDDLPLWLKEAADTQPEAEGKDKMILGTLTLLSGAAPNVYGVYDNRRIYAPFYTIISAPAAADKGQLTACRQLLMPIQLELDQENQKAQDDYQQQMAQYLALDKSKRAATPQPQEPPYRSVFIPANSSATATYQALSDNHGWGAIFETEADTMTQALKSDYGDYSDGLRKAFHHEPITYNRRKENERVSIYSPRLSIMLTCTPGQIPALLPSCENGLGSRFLFYNLSRRLYWRNVFERRDKTLDDQMLELGERYLKLYHALQQQQQHPLEFLFSQEQQQEFNRFFEGLQLEQVGLHGDDLIAFVRRLGLVCFRLAMMLTLLRHEQYQPMFDPLSQSLVCTDQDFHTAMTIANGLINHTAHVYTNLVPHDDKAQNAATGMSAPEKRLFDSLATEFTTADVRHAASANAIPWKTAERYLGKFVSHYHVVQRIKNGQYRKCC